MIQNPNIIVRNNFNKYGVISSGELTSQKVFTYEDNFQYLYLTIVINQPGNSIIIRDNGDNYSIEKPAELIHIYDMDCDVEIGNIIQLNAVGTKRIRIDARLATGVRIYIGGSEQKPSNAKVSVSSSWEYDKEVLLNKFIDIQGSDSTINYRINNNYTHKYIIFKVTATSDVARSETVSSFKGDGSNMLMVCDGYHNLGIQVASDTTKYFYAEIDGVNTINVNMNSTTGGKISSLAYMFTDSWDIVKAITGVKDYLCSMFKKNSSETINHIPIEKNKRWYVVKLIKITGSIISPISAVLNMNCMGKDGNVVKVPIYYEDMSSSVDGDYNLYGKDRIEGYYFAEVGLYDLEFIGNINFPNTVNVSDDFHVIIEHIGFFNDISQFVKKSNSLLVGDDRFELKYTGNKMFYALDDWWADFSYANNTITVGNKDNEKFTLNLSEHGWHIGANQPLKLIHPSYYKTTTPNTNIVINVTDTTDNNKDKWMVCTLNSITAILTKSNWTQVKFWEKEGTNRKIPVKNSALVDTKHRYDTTLPDSFYDYDEISSNGKHIAYQGVPSLYTLRYFGSHGKKMTVFGHYVSDNGRVDLWVTTDGGYNFVSVFDFGGLSITGGDIDINTSSFPDYTGGLTLWVVRAIYPSASNKEPEYPYTVRKITNFTLQKGTNTTIVFNEPRGSITASTDLLVFTGTTGTDWDQLTSLNVGWNISSVEENINATSYGDNAYMPYSYDDSHTILKVNRRSYDTQLKCRHIHSVNETKSGFIIATGERYPEGWTMFLEQKKKDASDIIDVMSQTFNIYRLNSSENSLQRACGVIMFEDEADPTIIFNSDDSQIITNMQWTIEGRTNLPMSSSNGIWKGKLSNIDDYSKFECIADIPDPAIWMFRYNGLIVGYYQLGGIAVSIDDGKSFRYYPYYDGVRPLVGVYQGKIVMNQGYTLEVK